MNHIKQPLGGASQCSPVQVEEGAAWAWGGWGACRHLWVSGQQAQG